ncbi:o-methyltransferase [Hirsutella rhossiliensis]|uniref:O-methyltransferase domain-containing protein n=1 Tax=Hirsutella rhossiliensis TaxID=111463 RepID=A0A9P8SGX4_9HYPO|nr:o-methyltransferase domain-containing protein [Hirsutella rhossiliensis]KAH0960411.1 o-methyltransferase domain-containing protein [Hirsutella rhossiliensis]
MFNLPEVATRLSQNVELLVDEIDKTRSLPNGGNPTLLGPKGFAARHEIMLAAEKLLQQGRGPGPSLLSLLESAVDVGTIQTLIRLEVPDHVPSTGSITYDALVKKLKRPVAPGLLQRLIRFARLAGFLDEDAEGAVKHSPMSAVFVSDPDYAGQARFMADFGIRPCSFLYESMALDPSGEVTRLGPLALMAREPGACEGPTFFEVLEKDPVNRNRWHDGMAVHNESMVRHVANAYDWDAVKSLIDVGGSEGHVATVIAEAFPHLQITVQDRPEIVEQACQRVDQHPNITFEEHDFFRPQPRIADAYLLRLILHDWNDADCTRIVGQICSALRPGARLLIMDAVLPEPGEGSLQSERQLRRSDIGMYLLFSAKERSLAQMRGLVEGCDSRLRFEKLYTPPGSHASMLSWICE